MFARYLTVGWALFELFETACPRVQFASGRGKMTFDILTSLTPDLPISGS